MKKMFLALTVLFLAVGLVSSASATVVTFGDFSDTSTLTLNGNTSVVNTVDGAVLRLTAAGPNQSGSAFNTATINAAAFSTYFAFRITNPGGSIFDENPTSGADGIVFVAQAQSASIGGMGQGIGYAGIQTSVGAEFDTWHNSYNNDPDSNHLGIDVNGNVNHGAGSPFALSIPTRFDDGNIWYSWVDYNGTTLEVRTNQTGIRPTNSMLSRDLDLATIIGVNNAYVGFTSGTGADWGNHDILNWEYRDYYQPIDHTNEGSTVPEPATMLMFTTGLICAALRKRLFV